MQTQAVYDPYTVFTHPDGHESFKPLMLQPEVWAEIDAAGGTTSLPYGYTRVEAEKVAALALPYLLAEFADFIDEGGSIRNDIDIFFG